MATTILLEVLTARGTAENGVGGRGGNFGCGWRCDDGHPPKKRSNKRRREGEGGLGGGWARSDNFAAGFGKLCTCSLCLFSVNSRPTEEGRAGGMGKDWGWGGGRGSGGAGRRRKVGAGALLRSRTGGGADKRGWTGGRGDGALECREGSREDDGRRKIGGRRGGGGRNSGDRYDSGDRRACLNLWLFHWLSHKPIHTLGGRHFVGSPLFLLSHETSSSREMRPFREILRGRFRRLCVDRRPYA